MSRMDTRTVNLVNPGSPGSGSPSTSPRFGTPTAAQQVLQQITPERRKLIDSILSGELGVLPKEDRERVGNIFNTLDTSGDGTLGEDDFDHPFASVKKTLMEVWRFLIEQFDFNQDGVIEPHEFLGHFIMYALYYMPAEPCTHGNLGDQLLLWESMFLRNFRHRVSEIETLVSSGR